LEASEDLLTFINGAAITEQHRCLLSKANTIGDNERVNSLALQPKAIGNNAMKEGVFRESDQSK